MAASRIILGTRKGVIVVTRARDGAWAAEPATQRGVPVPYAFVDERDGRIWASLDHGHWGQKLAYSDDGGANWSEAVAPKYPEGTLLREGEPAAVRYLWVIAPGGADEPRRLYIGSEPGGLFRSDDRGESWQLVQSLWNHPSREKQWFGGGRDEAGIHSVLVDRRDSSHILVGISCAGVFESDDGGESWTPRNRGLVADFLPDPASEVGQDPHLVVACASEPDQLWQQNHCGIFRSRDGAASWEAASRKGESAHFGFAIAVAPDDPDCAWVVPAVSDECRVAIDNALVVCRTEDGGATWTELRTGLPQRDCYDIVFRHALDLDGDRLAFGSTCGNLFISEDRGDSWRSLGNHFPPIYSVRLAQ